MFQSNFKHDNDFNNFKITLKHPHKQIRKAPKFGGRAIKFQYFYSVD